MTGFLGADPEQLIPLGPLDRAVRPGDHPGRDAPDGGHDRVSGGARAPLAHAPRRHITQSAAHANALTPVSALPTISDCTVSVPS